MNVSFRSSNHGFAVLWGNPTHTPTRTSSRRAGARYIRAHITCHWSQHSPVLSDVRPRLERSATRRGVLFGDVVTPDGRFCHVAFKDCPGSKFRSDPVSRSSPTLAWTHHDHTHNTTSLHVNFPCTYMKWSFSVFISFCWTLNNIGS